MLISCLFRISRGIGIARAYTCNTGKGGIHLHVHCSTFSLVKNWNARISLYWEDGTHLSNDNARHIHFNPNDHFPIYTSGMYTLYTIRTSTSTNYTRFSHARSTSQRAFSFFSLYSLIRQIIRYRSRKMELAYLILPSRKSSKILDIGQKRRERYK